MKLQYFNGGLGNQLFQYIFYRYFQLHSNEEIWLDDMKFYKVHEHNGYELERIFGVKSNLISDYFDADIWEYMVERAKRGEGDLCQQLKDMGEAIVMVAENDRFAFDGQVHRIPANGYYPEIIGLPGNVYYFGYWISRDWFAEIRPVIMKELSFPEIMGADNRNVLEIINKERTASVHIRRGDFCKLGWELPEHFYLEAMKKMSAHMPGAFYLVFSDDIDWCKDHFRELGLDMAGDRIVFVTGNEGADSYVDMQLMSMCEGMILANSAFSYFAALYNNRKDKAIINPLRFREV